MTEPAHADTAIRGHAISKVFKDFWGRDKIAALTDVDIEIRNGSVFGLLGPNGAGKSTLLKLILGHLYPTGGRLSVLGESPRNVAVKSRIGYLPERTGLYKNLTALETLTFFGSILGLSSEQIRLRSTQLLEMVGLKTAGKRLVGEFSHGMTRRMGLAQALLNDPDLLILDEPTAGLDPVGCREVKDLIITLGKRGKTIVLTSHLLADVEDVCDEILLLYGGRRQSTGSVKELLKNRNMTQLEFPNVNDLTLDKAKKILAGDVPYEQITASSPTESLESYFLKAVAQSNAEHKETAGAQMGSGVAEYLRDADYTYDSPGAIENGAKEKGVNTRHLDALAKSRTETEPTAEDAKREIDSRHLASLAESTDDTSREDNTPRQVNQQLLDELSDDRP